MYNQKPLIGVKGRLQTWVLENEDGTKMKKMEIIAEKVTFLASSRNGSEDSDWSEPEIIQEEKPKPKKQKK